MNFERQEQLYQTIYQEEVLKQKEKEFHFGIKQTLEDKQLEILTWKEQ